MFVFDEKDQLIATAGSAGVGSASECSASLTDVYRYSHSFTLTLPDDHAWNFQGLNFLIEEIIVIECQILISSWEISITDYQTKYQLLNIRIITF